MISALRRSSSCGHVDLFTIAGQVLNTLSSTHKTELQLYVLLTGIVPN